MLPSPLLIKKGGCRRRCGGDVAAVADVAVASEKNMADAAVAAPADDAEVAKNKAVPKTWNPASTMLMAHGGII